MSSKTEQLIKAKLEEIEHLKATQYSQDIIDVLQNKKHTEEELYVVCDAFTAYVEKKQRQANLEKARAEKKIKNTPSAPAS